MENLYSIITMLMPFISLSLIVGGRNTNSSGGMVAPLAKTSLLTLYLLGKNIFYPLSIFYVLLSATNLPLGNSSYMEGALPQVHFL
jgi:hypothetical protein